MGIATAITLSISIITFLLGITYKLINLSVNFGKLTKTVETNEQRDIEERKANAEKFAELYNYRNKHESQITKLDTTINSINTTLEKFDSKLDRIESRLDRIFEGK